MTFIHHRKKIPLAGLNDFSINENDLLKVSGVSSVRIRQGTNWQTFPISGEVNLLELCGIQGTPGDYDVELGDHELSLSVGLVHFTEEQINGMVDFLQSQEYRLDMKKAGGQVSRTYSALQDDIEAFLRHWHELEEVVRAIVRRPGEQLTTELTEVSLQHRQRHNAATLALNLRAGRLNAQGQPTTESIYALNDQVTLDIAENSHLVSVVEAYETRRDLLLNRVPHQLESLKVDIERETSYGSMDKKIGMLNHMHVVLSQLQEELQNLEPMPLPDFWRSFHHKASIDTNRARFDERYSRVIDLEEQLRENQIRKRPPHALELLQDCGRRATWSLYEYWLLAQTFTQLIDLGFNCDDPDGFQAFEDWQGGSYGLVENRSVTFTHDSGLKVRLTYEKHVVWKEAGKQSILKPDIVLEFIDLSDSTPLVLDAKYKSYTKEHRNLARDLEKSARRYDRALGGATAFLVHVGRTGWDVWPARSRQSQEPPKAPFKPEDLPFRHGVVRVFPGASGDNIEEEVRPLRRLLVTWLIRNGIFWICFYCGKNLINQNTRRANRLTGEDDLDVTRRHIGYTTANRNWPKFASYQCPCCDMTGMLTFCGTCAKGSAGHWEPIFKYVPREISGSVKDAQVSEDWSKVFEIHHVVRKKSHLRHCAACGASL